MVYATTGSCVNLTHIRTNTWTVPGALSDTLAGQTLTITASSAAGCSSGQSFVVPIDTAIAQSWVSAPSTNFGIVLQVDR